MSTILKDSFLYDALVYVSRIKQFKPIDVAVYIVWVGLMYGLFAVVSAFLYVGYSNGVIYPDYVWNIPLGTFIFSTAIAIDTIGHRTIYKEVLKKGEALIHHITIASGITSVMALCLAYGHREFMMMPAAVLIFLSILYSVIDEAMHWHRYLTSNSDRVEMWSHFSILLGHLIMIGSWWIWFSEGYLGVSETLAVLAK
ncbi:MAG: hypothetical protein COT74_03495 [Bdellovibrionales bacterium CG10_big_fil_rev_8_21_14_0_10_45_34]|nr:MAG: hypothetical protein COT74_03495 [Bdellovibrionales bacterium CG10_big_fil_rev_8_21_14_0_10_45_34]